MNWTDAEIDKLFAENTTKPVEFREEYWTEVESMLPPEPVRKTFPWITTGISACVVGALITLFVLLRPSATHEELAGVRMVRQGIPASGQAFASQDEQAALINDSEEIQTRSEVSSAGYRIAQNTTGSSPIQRPVVTPSVQDPYSVESTLGSPGNHAANTARQLTTKSTLRLPAPKQIPGNTQAETDRTTLHDIGRLPALALQVSPSGTPAAAPILPVVRRRINLYADLGIGLGRSLMSQGDELTKNVSLSAGADFPVGKRTAFSAGAGFTTISYNNLEINESTTHYGFGKVNYRNKFRYKELYLAQTPLQFTFYAKRSAFQLLLTPGYLIQTKMKYTYYENDQELERTVIYGETHGLDRFSLQAGIGYRYLLTANFEIGLRCQSELLQNISNGGASAASNSFPIQGQLFLRKKLAF